MTDSGKLVTVLHNYECVTLFLPGALVTVIDRQSKHDSKIIIIEV